MKKDQFVILTLLLSQINQSCKESTPKSPTDANSSNSYDMRSDLTPARLTIAMWNFSWLFMHYPGGAFEDYDKVTDELLEHGFNTIKIDAFPLIIAKLDSVNQLIIMPGDSLRN